MAEAEETELRLPNVRREEKDKLSAILTPLGLAVRDISPDGHCLYAAVCDQLSVKVNIKVCLESHLAVLLKVGRQVFISSGDMVFFSRLLS